MKHWMIGIQMQCSYLFYRLFSFIWHMIFAYTLSTPPQTLPIILLVLVDSFFLSSHRLLIPLGTLCIVISSILTYSLCLIYLTIEYKFMQLHFFSIIRISQLAFYPADLLQQLFCGWLFYISIYRHMLVLLELFHQIPSRHIKGCMYIRICLYRIGYDTASSISPWYRW